MSKEAFFSSVRQACRVAPPVIAIDSDKIDAHAIDQALRGTDLWLTSRAVEGYDPIDYTELPSAARDALTGAVEGFRRVVATVPPNAPASQAQRDEAWGHFARITAMVREQVLAEWRAAIDGLYRQVEALAATHDWGTKRLPKTFGDSFLGKHELPQLLLHRPDARFIFDPVTRYAPGTTGIIDLYVMPSLGGTMLTRADGNWRIHPLQHGQPFQPWSEGALLSTLDGLVRAAA